MGDVEIKKEMGGAEKSGAERHDVCRDFLNNICNRGSRCKFFHPEEVKRERAQDTTGSKTEFNFCIDFQNRGCQRDNCRFIHAHRDDVERYKSSGEVTLNLVRAIASVHNGDTVNGIPFCKEFQTGVCSRGVLHCHYWHVNVEEERERRRRASRGLSRGPGHLRAGVTFDFSAPYGATGAPKRALPYGGAGEPYDAMINVGAKRARFEENQDYSRYLQCKNAEQIKEIEGLKRELQRERERIADLFALLRQRNEPLPAAPTPVPEPMPSAASYGNLSNGAPVPAPGGYYQPSPQPPWTPLAWSSNLTP